MAARDALLPAAVLHHFWDAYFWDAYGKGAGQTRHVERWNNTLRQRLARFVRQTLSFSKSGRMHKICLLLFVHDYNQSRWISDNMNRPLPKSVV